MDFIITEIMGQFMPNYFDRKYHGCNLLNKRDNDK